jgi:hypothetical protein
MTRDSAYALDLAITNRFLLGNKFPPTSVQQPKVDL